MRAGTKRLAAVTVATAAVAVAGFPAAATAKKDPAEANPQSIISSYLGPLGLRDDFSTYRKANDGDIVDVFISFAELRGIDLPEGIGGNDLPT
jgi:hypothetical protein